jgi:hypothetical protein
MGIACIMVGSCVSPVFGKPSGLFRHPIRVIGQAERTTLLEGVYLMKMAKSGDMCRLSS